MSHYTILCPHCNGSIQLRADPTKRLIAEAIDPVPPKPKKPVVDDSDDVMKTILGESDDET
jgi:hypothetical protein